MFSDVNKSPLIVDDDEAFLLELFNDARAKTSNPIFARTGKEAQLILGNLDIPISGVFVNLELKSVAKSNDPSPISVIKFSKRLRINTPLYGLQATGSKIDCEGLGLKEVFTKPLSLTKILELVAPDLITFDPTQIDPSKNTDKLDQEVADGDSDFVAILANDFISGSNSFFSIYAKSGSGRFLKILHANDSFEPERLASYFKKGVKHFYIRKDDQEQHLKYTQQISSKILNKSAVPIEIKASQTLNYGHETIQYLHDQGISESRLHHATTFVNNIRDVVNKMTSADELVSSILSNIDNYEHGVSTAMVTSLIGSYMGIKSESAVQIVGISSLLHDIGLGIEGHKLELLDISEMTKEQLEIYYAHPRKGAEMMMKIPGTHPTVIQAIMQHQERRGKKAFDQTQERPKAINGIAELIGIVDEYLLLVRKSKTDPSFEIKKYMEKEIFCKFSIDTSEAFKKAMFPTKKPR